MAGGEFQALSCKVKTPPVHESLLEKAVRQRPPCGPDHGNSICKYRKALRPVSLIRLPGRALSIVVIPVTFAEINAQASAHTIPESIPAATLIQVNRLLRQSPRLRQKR